MDTVAPSDQPTQRVSERFNAADSDVTFQSSDGVLFRVHRKNLDTHASGFPPPALETQGEVVPLTENASTLELLFQFMYPHDPPDLGKVPFETVSSLAEAGQKYKVFFAIHVCKAHFKTILPGHVNRILAYAARHEEYDLLQQMVPQILQKPLDELVYSMPRPFLIRWILHYQEWTNILRSTVSASASHSHGIWRCPYTGCSRAAIESPAAQILSRLKDVGSLADLNRTFSTDSMCCKPVKDDIHSWRLSVESAIGSIPQLQDPPRHVTRRPSGRNSHVSPS